jgi:HAE1 family hydrophobic/amphiphilic exporter-1
VYINAAISLVQQNIIIGGILAICILMLFLRSFRPTLIIMLAIPVSVIGTFVAISWLGLSVNVISLAGLAFAVGMVVDASIVSQENISGLQYLVLH